MTSIETVREPYRAARQGRRPADRHYEDPTGFQRPGLGIYVGPKIAFAGEPAPGGSARGGDIGLQPGAQDLRSRR
jgi:hypothetical protein